MIARLTDAARAELPGKVTETEPAVRGTAPLNPNVSPISVP